MMNNKSIGYLILAILLAGCSSSNEHTPDTKMMKLNGNVESVKQFSYKAVEQFGEITKGERSQSSTIIRLDPKGDYFIRFNGQGNISEWSSYSENDNLDSKRFHIYDENGNVVDINVYNAEGELIARFRQDEFGNILELIFYRDGNIRSNMSFDYEFDENNNWIKQVEFEDGKALFILEREITYNN